MPSLYAFYEKNIKNYAPSLIDLKCLLFLALFYKMCVNCKCYIMFGKKQEDDYA